MKSGLNKIFKGKSDYYCDPKNDPCRYCCVSGKPKSQCKRIKEKLYTIDIKDSRVFFRANKHPVRAAYLLVPKTYITDILKRNQLNPKSIVKYFRLQKDHRILNFSFCAHSENVSVLAYRDLAKLSSESLLPVNHPAAMLSYIEFHDLKKYGITFTAASRWFRFTQFLFELDHKHNEWMKKRKS